MQAMIVRDPLRGFGRLDNLKVLDCDWGINTVNILITEKFLGFFFENTPMFKQPRFELCKLWLQKEIKIQG